MFHLFDVNATFQILNNNFEQKIIFNRFAVKLVAHRQKCVLRRLVTREATRVPSLLY